MTVPVIQAVIRAINQKAARGDHRSQRLAVEMLRAVESEWARERADTYRVFAEYKYEMELSLGLVGDEPLPHPDHITLEKDGRVSIRGPFDREQKALWDKLARRKQDLEFEDELHRRMLTKRSHPSEHQNILRWMEQNRASIERLGAVLGNYQGPELTARDLEYRDECLRDIDENH